MTYLTNSNGILFFRAILDLRWSDTRTLSKKNLGCCWALTDFVSGPRFDAWSFNRWCWLLHLSREVYLTQPKAGCDTTDDMNSALAAGASPRSAPTYFASSVVDRRQQLKIQSNHFFLLQVSFLVHRRLLSFMFWHLDGFSTGCILIVPQNYYKLVWVFR